MKHWWFAVIVLFLLRLPVSAQQQDDDWGDDWGEEKASPWTFAGFAELGYGQFLQNNIVANDQSLAEARARLELNYTFSRFTFSAKGDLTSDKITSDTRWQTREFNIKGTITEQLDVKLGRQVLTWGTGDYLFLNDLFPKDWQSFFSGRDDEYLKFYSDSLKLSYYWKSLGINFVWTPDFTADNYLTGERFSFYSKAGQQQVAPDSHFQVAEQDKDTFALRLTLPVNDIDFALYANKGFWTTPSAVNEYGMPYFAKLTSIGASAQGAFAQGLLNVELSWYRSEEDKQGNLAAVPNSQIRVLLGYEQELITDLKLSVQAYIEKTQDYQQLLLSSPWPQLEVSEHRTLLTQRLTYNAMQQKLWLTLFSFYSPSDHDWYIRPSLSYRVDDHWQMSAGANLFNGNHAYSFFGQHEDNSNVYFRLRYNF